MGAMDEIAGRVAPLPLASLSSEPRLRLAIVCCMDCRIDANFVLGLRPGEAHVIRNAGARVAEALRSLIVSQRMLGTREIAVIGHTRCGMEGLASEQLAADLKEDTGHSVHIDFLSMNDVFESVREDCELLRTHPHLAPDTVVSGYVLDIETGELKPV